MTYAKWEKDFKRELSFLKKSESEEVAAYYRELYGDKSDAGMSCDDILFEFGSPQHCAAKILEERIHNNFPDASLKDESVRPTRERNGTPLFRYIGLFFFTILITVPVLSVLFSLIAALGAVCISGVALALGGLLIVIFCWLPIIASSLSVILFNLSVGLISMGVGALLFVVFMYATKYTAIFTVKLVGFIYVKRRKN